MSSIKRNQKSGKWSFVLDGPTVNGKRNQIRRSGFRTRKEAEVAEAALRTDMSRGLVVQPTKGTLADFLENRWLPARRPDLRPSTILGYEKAIRRIVPVIGYCKLSALDAATLETFYAHLSERGGLDGRPLSAKTVQNAAGVLSVALSDAVRWKLLRYNVASDAHVPRREHREMTAWTEEETVRFLDAIGEDRLHPMWRLVLATGMRRGELAGLKWKHVDLAAGTLTVETTRVVAESVMTGEPKTRAGRRVISLDSDTVTVIGKWKRRLATERLAAGEMWEDHGYVFVTELGVPPHPETITRWWREAAERAGVPVIRLHDARHTAATVLLRAGVPVKVVSQRLGHADVAVTMRVYQHVTAQDDRAAADALGDAFRKKA